MEKLLNKKMNVIILLTILVVLCSITIFYKVYSNGYYYISNLGDTRYQYIHFYNLFYDMIHKGEWPFWTWSFGMGGSFWNDFGYYVVGDIFVWPLLLFPKDWFPALFLPLDIIKLWLMALGMYFFLCETGVRIRFAFIGAMTYPFVGFYYEFFYTHYFFLNAAVFFPYILWGYERVLKQKGKFTFILSTFIASIGSFYLMFMCSLGFGLYALFRYFAQDVREKSFKDFIQFHLEILGYYIIGLGMSMVVFLPSLYGYFHSNAQVRNSLTMDYWIDWSDTLKTFFWNGGINFLPFVVIPSLFINKRSLIPLGCLGLVLWFMVEIPPLTSILGGFSKPEEFRGFFLFNCLLTTVSIQALDKIDFGRKRNIVVLLLTSYWIYHWIHTNQYSQYNTIISILPFALALALICYNKISIKVIKNILMIALLLIVTSYGVLLGRSFTNDIIKKTMDIRGTIYHQGVWSVLPLMKKANYDSYYKNDHIKKALSILKQKDNGLYRIEINDPGVLAINSSMTYGYHSFVAYQSLIPWNQQKFEMDVLARPGSRGLNLIRGFSNSLYMNTLLGDRYYLALEKGATSHLDKFGYTNIYNQDGISIYKNNYNLPIGFVYQKYTGEKSFFATPYPYREKVLFENAVIPDAVAKGISGTKEINTQEFNIKQIGDLNRISFGQGVTTKNTPEGLLVKTNQPFNIKIPVREHKSGDLSVYVHIIPHTPDNGLMINASNGEREYKFEKNMTGNQYVLSQYSYKNTVNDVLFKFGVDSTTRYINLNIHPGEFLIKDIGVYLDPLDNYKKVVKRHNQNGLEVKEFSNNKIDGRVNSDGGIMFLSIPYSTGWKVSVDGKAIKTFPVNYTFTGFKVPPGKHHIEMHYIPEGFILGSIVSGAALFALIVVLLFSIWKKR